MRIAMVSDFFLPKLGGIEIHILNLSINLIKLGHKVVVLTHHHNLKFQIKYIENVKVYYLPIPILVQNCTFPSFFSSFFTLKKIFRLEKIQLIHTHQSMSPLAFEALLVAKICNLKTVFTDHSCFEKNNLENIIVNRFGSFVFKNIDKNICVSFELKKNFLERINVNNEDVFVIPNAVSKIFRNTTNELKRETGFGMSKGLDQNFNIKKITKNSSIYEKKKKFDDINRPIKIAVCCRFVYRKGIDLLLAALPITSKKLNCRFYLIGDGPRKDEIDQMIEENNCPVELIGLLSQEKLNRFLNSCDIFLNTSLTESFCIAILEAACCGLNVISTDVGGVSEVLPKKFIKLVKPTVKDVIKGIEESIKLVKPTIEECKELKKKYSWKRISKMTIKVYKSINKIKSFDEVFNDTGMGVVWLFRMILLIMKIMDYLGG